jgi:hypothetical protein
MTGKIFVNYRRDDSAPHALSIAQYLEREFGTRNVFIDIDRMRAGQNFHRVLEQRLSDCSVVLTVIGPSWLQVRNEGGQRRIDDPEDWVRLELARSLARGITTIPVLVGGAELPKKSELPDDLKPLVQHHAAVVTTNGFRSDMAGLVRDIRDIIGASPAWRKVALGLAALAVVLAGGAALYQFAVPGEATLVLGPLKVSDPPAQDTAKAAAAKEAADKAGVEAEARRVAAAQAEAKSKAEAEAERQRLAALEAGRKAAATAPTTPTAPAKDGTVSDPALLKEIRARLYALNFDPGPIEGGEPASTEGAIKEFEAQIKTAETGRPTLALLDQLRSIPDPRPWGTIVYARSSEKWGMAWGQATRREAVASARSSCGDRSTECAIEISFFGSECAAFAHSSVSWAITARTGIAEAKEAALTDCRKRGESCRIIASVCANGTERYGVK